MKILHVAETGKGGISSYLNEIMPLQSEAWARDQVKLVLPASHGEQLLAVDAAQIIAYDRPDRSVRSLWNLTKSVTHTVKTFKPDLIHAHSTFAGVLVRLMYGWRPGRPIIIYCPHGWAFNMQIPAWQRWAYTVIEQLLALVSDGIIAISKHEASEARRIGIGFSRLAIIPNAISRTAPPAAAATWQDQRRKILFVGRLDQQKGFDVLAEAVRGLEDRVVVRVAGEGVVGKSASITAGNIECLGWLSAAEIEGQLHCADAVVMPSRWEGFGLTAVEAMRAGKPVIATAVGGLPEIIVHGITGRLVEPNDANALRHALLADAPDVLQAMGAAGRQRFLRLFTIDRLHTQIMALYASHAHQKLSAPHAETSLVKVRA